MLSARGDTDPVTPVDSFGLLTGVVIEVPAAEPAVGQLRHQQDPRAVEGLPAYITVLSPFRPAHRLDPPVHEQLATIAASRAAFAFDLVRVGWFGNQTLWLAPQDDRPFHELTAELWRVFPDCPPYGGQFAEVVPHLTVADGAPVAAMRRAAEQLGAQLPITCAATALSLFEQARPGGWRRTARFALGLALT